MALTGPERELHRANLARNLTDGGMPKQNADGLAEMMASMESVKEIGAYVNESSAYFITRGILLDPNSSEWMRTLLNWQSHGGSIAELEAREKNINLSICWKPRQDDGVNNTLREFFHRVSEEFKKDRHLSLPSQMKPPSRIAGYYKQRGVKYATCEELARMFTGLSPAPGASGTAAEIISDLPYIVTEADAARYATILGDHEGTITVTTRFPVKFALIPIHELFSADKEGHLLALVPESRTVSQRLQSTKYRGGFKINHFPGTLAFLRFMLHQKARIGLITEIQSDHDPRETKSLGLEDWPDILRSAAEQDMKSRGMEYSLSPKIMPIKHLSYAPHTEHGLNEKMIRAYGTDDKPPRGYTDLQASNIGIADKTFLGHADPESYYVKKL